MQRYTRSRLVRALQSTVPSSFSTRYPGFVRAAGLFAGWALVFAFGDLWLLGTRFDHYLASGQPMVAALAFTLNLLLFAVLVLLATSVLGRPRTAFLCTAALYLLVALASRLKLANLGEPLLPWDWLSIRQFAGMSSGYVALDTGSTLAIGIVVGATAAALVLWRHERRVSRWKALIGALALGLPLYVLYIVVEPIRKPLGLLNMAWAQAANLRAHGLLNHLALNLRPALVIPPLGYGESAMRALCAADGASPLPAPPQARRHPHVIVVLNEAFTRIDRTLAPDVAFNAELAPFFGSLAPVTVSVPSFGGYTANTEFEILTGTPIAFLPSGAIPFQHYLRDPQPNALPRLFRAAGYRALALHPFHRTFWNRDQAFALLGFERFVAIDDLKLPPTPYVRDAALVDPIASLVAQSEQPLFLFVTTMENHGPWSDRRYATRDIEVTHAPDGWSATARETLATYGQGVRNADGFLRELTGRFAGRQDVLIAMFGDHQPTIVVPDMGNRNLMSLRFGDPARSLPPRFDERAILETEIAFWPRSVSLPTRAQVTLLGPALARTAGVPLDAYWQTVERIGAMHPTIQKRFATGIDGGKTSLEAAQELDALRLLQHDALFGSRYAATYCAKAG